MKISSNSNEELTYRRRWEYKLIYPLLKTENKCSKMKGRKNSPRKTIRKV